MNLDTRLFKKSDSYRENMSHKALAFVAGIAEKTNDRELRRIMANWNDSLEIAIINDDMYVLGDLVPKVWKMMQAAKVI